MNSDYQIIKALAKLVNVDEDKAEAIMLGFKQSSQLEVMREYWNAKTPRQKAIVIKQNWL